MEFRILGPLGVWAGGCSIDVGGGRQRLLLARLLVASNEVVPLDALVEELWLGKGSPGARQALHTQVSRLRKALASAGCGDILRSESSGYVLDVGVDALDAARFERWVVRAREAAAEGGLAAAAGLFRAAEACWTGAALAEFSDYPFAQAAAARLEELRLSAVEERIRADLAAGRHDELAGELETLVAAHPLRERLWGMLMLALYRTGRQSEALRAYQRLRSHLIEELGIEPSVDLARLEQSVLVHDRALYSRVPQLVA